MSTWPCARFDHALQQHGLAHPLAACAGIPERNTHNLGSQGVPATLAPLQPPLFPLRTQSLHRSGSDASSDLSLQLVWELLDENMVQLEDPLAGCEGGAAAGAGAPGGLGGSAGASDAAVKAVIRRLVEAQCGEEDGGPVGDAKARALVLVRVGTVTTREAAGVELVSSVRRALGVRGHVVYIMTIQLNRASGRTAEEQLNVLPPHTCTPSGPRLEPGGHDRHDGQGAPPPAGQQQGQGAGAGQGGGGRAGRGAAGAGRGQQR